MKIISIGSDRNLFNERSEARARIGEYGKLADEMHIIVFNRKPGFEKQNFGNIYLYPTNSKSKLFYIFDAIKIGSCMIKKNGEWLVMAQDPFEAGIAGYRIAKKLKQPLQLQVHTDFLNPYFKKESLLNRIRVSIAKILIPRADSIRVVSERIKHSLNSVFRVPNSKISVLPVFIDVQKIQKSPAKISLRKKYSQFDFIILMVSRLTREKNIGLAIEAMAEITKKYPKTGLVIVGNGPEKENCSLLHYTLRVTR